ncbi:MAG: hypothetical protein KC445_18310 [Anaerolineales bacterium]|nr:hypothetical protein [Anaerolineales bacterium]
MSNQLDNDGSHVFILRLWREPGTNKDAAPEWRALIENVSTSTRYPIKDTTILRALLTVFEDDVGMDDFLQAR